MVKVKVEDTKEEPVPKVKTVIFVRYVNLLILLFIWPLTCRQCIGMCTV